MNIERLKQLRDFMAALPESRVCMSFYMRDKMHAKRDMTAPEFKTKANECGTVGCIAGYATQLAPPEFYTIGTEIVAGEVIENNLLYRSTARAWLQVNVNDDIFEDDIFDPMIEEELELGWTDKQAAIARLEFAIDSGGTFNSLRYSNLLVSENQ